VSFLKLVVRVPMSDEISRYVPLWDASRDAKHPPSRRRAGTERNQMHLPLHPGSGRDAEGRQGAARGGLLQLGAASRLAQMPYSTVQRLTEELGVHHTPLPASLIQEQKQCPRIPRKP